MECNCINDTTLNVVKDSPPDLSKSKSPESYSQICTSLTEKVPNTGIVSTMTLNYNTPENFYSFTDLNGINQEMNLNYHQNFMGCNFKEEPKIYSSLDDGFHVKDVYENYTPHNEDLLQTPTVTCEYLSYPQHIDYDNNLKHHYTMSLNTQVFKLMFFVNVQ